MFRVNSLEVRLNVFNRNDMKFELFALQTLRAGKKPYIMGAIIKVRQRGSG